MAGWRAPQARYWLRGLGIRVRLYNVKMIKRGTVVVLSPRVSRSKGFWELKHARLMQEAIDALDRASVDVIEKTSQLQLHVSVPQQQEVTHDPDPHPSEVILDRRQRLDTVR